MGWRPLFPLPLHPRASPTRAARGPPPRSHPHCLSEEKPKPHPHRLQKLGNLASFLPSLDPSEDLAPSLQLRVPWTVAARERAFGSGCPHYQGLPARCISWSEMMFTSPKLVLFSQKLLSDRWLGLCHIPSSPHGIPELAMPRAFFKENAPPP